MLDQPGRLLATQAVQRIGRHVPLVTPGGFEFRAIGEDHQYGGIVDLIDEPQRTGALMKRLGEVFRRLTEAIWERIPLFHGGYFDGQYSLWAPGPIARLQEDATAGYSPTLYRRIVQPVDRELLAPVTDG